MTNKRVMWTFSYHLCYTECVSKIMKRSCIVIPENFKQEVLKDGFLRKKQIRNNQLREDKLFLHSSLFEFIKTQNNNEKMSCTIKKRAYHTE